MHNGSGMFNVSKNLCEAERLLGLDSIMVNIHDDKTWEPTLDADIHVSHTHIPVVFNGKAFTKQITKPFRMVGIFHGTPEHVFQGSVEAGLGGAYAPSNSLMIMQHDLKRAHARVTFWERHKWIYDTMAWEGTKIHCVPLGVRKNFWNAGVSRGKFQGSPSVWTGENAHYIKWPLDLLLAWPYVSEAVDDAYLHVAYLPHDQHRYFFPLAHSNGAYWRSHIGPWTYPHEELRNVLKSVDFFCGLVKYGDFNMIQLEASATQFPKLISYPGNPYSDFWVPEGDQRQLALELGRVLRGEVEPRKRTEAPDIMETAEAFKLIYEEIAP